MNDLIAFLRAAHLLSEAFVGVTLGAFLAWMIASIWRKPR